MIDVWDALYSNRPYRQGWPLQRVLKYIRNASGSHFDPEVVKAFLEINPAIEEETEEEERERERKTEEVALKVPVSTIALGEVRRKGVIANFLEWLNG